MNFFDPSFDVIDPELDIPVRIKRYQDILEEQVSISYSSNGSISIVDTDEMCPLDRAKILKILVDIKQKEKQQIEEATKR